MLPCSTNKLGFLTCTLALRCPPICTVRSQDIHSRLISGNKVFRWIIAYFENKISTSIWTSFESCP